jgi:SAM-dependent methyltransferase
MTPPANSALLDDELLDDPDADPAAVAISLHNITVANRWFGGWWAVRRGLSRVTRRRGDAATRRPSGPRESKATRTPGTPLGRLVLLDVGCGCGDLTRRTVTWARSHGMAVVPLGLERHRTAARLTLGTGVPAMLGSAGALPVREKSVDIVLASQLAHHLPAQQLVEFCRAADRVARLGVVIADLRRSRWALAAFWVGSRLFGFDPATRRDGLTSVRRGFTRDELTELLRQGGIAARVERSPGFRLVASWTTSETV